MKYQIALILNLVMGLTLVGHPPCTEAKDLMRQHLKDQPSHKKALIFKKAKDLCPTSVHPNFLLGLVEEKYQDTRKQPNYQEAMKTYQTVINLDPKHLRARFQLAGLEYIMGDFDSAASNYHIFLNQAKVGEEWKEMLEAAEELAVKCGWLALAPGKIKMGILRKDKARFRAVAQLVGDVSIEIGESLFSSTGDISGLAIGSGIALVAELFGTKKQIDYQGINQAIKKEKWAKLYRKGWNNIARIINDKGIDSEDTKVLLEHLLIAGANLDLPVRQLKPIAKAVQYNNVHTYKDIEYTGNLDALILSTLVLSFEIED